MASVGRRPADRRGPFAGRRGRRDWRDLLWLEHLDGRDTPEARRFLALDVEDPRCDDARVCADVLDVGVRALEALRLAGITSFREAA